MYVGSTKDVSRKQVSGLTLQQFDEALGDADVPVTADAFAVAIIAGCRHRLLTARESSLRALREGFVEHVDLRLQLGALGK